MTLKIYVARDSYGREWPPNTPHETEACEWMLKKAWMEFQHLQELYAIIVNLKEPSADMVILREIGLGVLELKDHFGEISVNRDGVWMAGPVAIHSGGQLNPREQVKVYATKLRAGTIREILPARMQTNRNHWDEVKFQTGVCFTNPLAKLEKVKKQIEERRPRLENWEESFSVFDINFFTSWVRELRFDLRQDPPRDFAPVHIRPETIVKIAEKSLQAVEWQEMIAAMPESNPYGHLILEDDAGREIFNLTRDHSIIGRSHECDVVLPSRYGRVSKRHFEIKRNVSGITIADLGSRNGTFIRNKSIKKHILTRLEHGNVLSLGGPTTSGKSCILTFELHGKLSDETTVTEQGTRDFRQISNE